MLNKILPMTGVEPRTSGIKSNRSTNWATTTALFLSLHATFLKPTLNESLCQIILLSYGY